MGKSVLEARDISKNFYDPVKVTVLHNISFSIGQGEFVSVTGKSGCGKSTLLYVLSTMDTDYSGDLLIDGNSMTGKRAWELSKIRNEKIGFVFQFHYLLNEFNVLRNVMLPALKRNQYPQFEIEKRALQKLQMLDVDQLAYKKTNQLSGGEKQRVAIARALINDPKILLCDEPTGNLDKKNSEIVFSIFRRLCEDINQTLLVVTHDLGFAQKTHRTIEMEDGRIIKQ